MADTAANQAFIQISEKIINLELPPGSVIREVDLMEELNLGRTPIREALKLLQAENLVVVKPWRGMFVAGIEITDLTQIYEIRIELEALAARLAAKRIRPEHFSELDGLLSAYPNIDRMDKLVLIAIDRKFHRMLASITGNRLLIRELDRFYNLSLRIWHLVLSSLRPEDLNIDDHIEILEKIKSQDSENAEKLMRKHLQDFQNTIKHLL